MMRQIFEGATLAACTVVGRVAKLPGAAPGLGSANPTTRQPRCVLVIAAHPDDEVAGCGGSMCLHRRAGDDVHIALITDGGASRALSMTRAQMSATRLMESRAAHEVLSISQQSVHRFDLCELTWSEDVLFPALASLVDHCAPDLIYAPSRIDGHPDHFRTARALARVLARPRSPAPPIRAYQVQIPLTPMLTNVVIDTSSVTEELTRALHAYRSQLSSLDRTMRMRRYTARLHGTKAMAEPFWELPASSYSALHHLSDEDWQKEADAWFGFRPNPYRDAWAYLRGLKHRWNIRVRALGGS